MFVFFFKQKTAYEMRISDWSSDVCSSDLSSVAIILLFPISTAMLIHKSQRGKYAACDRSPRSGQIFRRSPRRRRRVAGGARRRDLRRERKSVVWGKRVSVRVDLGGRRIIEKKIQVKNTQ